MGKDEDKEEHLYINNNPQVTVTNIIFNKRIHLVLRFSCESIEILEKQVFGIEFIFILNKYNVEVDCLFLLFLQS